MTKLKLPFMLLRELTCPPRLQRCPEPTAEMDDADQVAAFHAQGASILIPVYHFNALATSCLVPAGGTVVDLGSGSGQYLAYLAQRRPDLRIIGFDLAPTMVEVGNRFLAQAGLAERVQLRIGDMTAFADTLPGPVDLVSSVFSLHHLPSEAHLQACLEQIWAVREREGCAVWIFDHARPRHPQTPRVFPDIFSPDAPDAFKADSCNSLMASYSFEELTRLMESAGLGRARHCLSRWMRLYQVHWLEAAGSPLRPGPWQHTLLTGKAGKDYAGLRRLFPSIPQDG